MYLLTYQYDSVQLRNQYITMNVTLLFSLFFLKYECDHTFFPFFRKYECDPTFLEVIYVLKSVAYNRDEPLFNKSGFWVWL